MKNNTFSAIIPCGKGRGKGRGKDGTFSALPRAAVRRRGRRKRFRPILGAFFEQENRIEIFRDFSRFKCSAFLYSQSACVSGLAWLAIGGWLRWFPMIALALGGRGHRGAFPANYGGVGGLGFFMGLFMGFSRRFSAPAGSLFLATGVSLSQVICFKVVLLTSHSRP